MATALVKRTTVVPVSTAAQIVNSRPYKVWSPDDLVQSWTHGRAPSAETAGMALWTAARRGLIDRVDPHRYQCSLVARSTPYGSPPPVHDWDDGTTRSRDELFTKLLTTPADWAMARPAIEGAYLSVSRDMPLQAFADTLKEQSTVVLIAGREPVGIAAFRPDGASRWIVTCLWVQDGVSAKKWLNLAGKLVKRVAEYEATPGDRVVVETAAGCPRLKSLGFTACAEGWSLLVPKRDSAR